MSKMNEQQLPPGWHWAPFEEIADLLAGRAAPQGGEYFDDAGYPFVRVQDMGRLGAQVRLADTRDHVNDKAATTLQLFRAGAVLFTKSGASTLLNQRAILSRPMYVVSHIAAAVPYEGILSEWLYYWLCTVDFANYAHATTLPSLPLSKVKAITAPVAPVNEQARIVNTLDELFSHLDAGVASLERVREKLKLYRASVLKAAVEGALTADWRAQHPDTEPATELLKRILTERRRRWEEEQLAKFKANGQEAPNNWKTKYKEPVNSDTTNLPALPEGWCWASLDQLSSLVTSGSRGWKEYYSDQGATFIRSQDIRTDRLEVDAVAHVCPPSNSEGTRTQVHRGDLLVTITGANVAKAALVDVDFSKAYVSQHVGLIRFVEAQIGRFVHVFAIAPSGGRKRLLAAAYGAGKPGLNLDNLKELQVPLPPVSEMAAITESVDDQLSIIEHVEADLAAKLKSAQTLRQSILRHAFTGQLVPQDPNDEPASELLKRIITEREARARETAAAKQANKKTSRPGIGRREQTKKNQTKDD